MILIWRRKLWLVLLDGKLWINILYCFKCFYGKLLNKRESPKWALQIGNIFLSRKLFKVFLEIVLIFFYEQLEDNLMTHESLHVSLSVLDWVLVCDWRKLVMLNYQNFLDTHTDRRSGYLLLPIHLYSCH